LDKKIAEFGFFGAIPFEKRKTEILNAVIFLATENKKKFRKNILRILKIY